MGVALHNIVVSAKPVRDWRFRPRIAKSRTWLERKKRLFDWSTVICRATAMGRLRDYWYESPNF